MGLYVKCNSVAVSILILLTVSAAGDANAGCSSQCPNGRTSTNVCLIGQMMGTGEIEKWNSKVICGDDTERFFIESTDEALNLFSNLESSCKTIGKLVLLGHGFPGIVEPGHLNLKTVPQFSRWSCLMEPNARIDIKACNVARNCQGALFLKQLALTFLPKGGSVTAPSGYFITHTPVNLQFSTGGWVTLDYSPSRSERDQWSYDGILKLRMNGSFLEACQREFLDNLSFIRSAFQYDGVRSCLKKFGSDFIHQYEKLAPLYSQMQGDIPADGSALRDLAEFHDYLSNQAREAKRCIH